MDVLRELALEQGMAKEGSILEFHRTFLNNIQAKGRIHELSVILGYLVSSGGIFKVRKVLGDLIIGLKMFRRGKLVLFPHRTKGLEQVQRIFKSTVSPK
jgi:heterodisulfide reductase subunit C